MSRASDAARPEAEDTLGRVGQSAAAGFDGTHRSDDGSPAHVNVAQSGNRMAIGIGGSRATLTPDAMDGFGGIAITDGYGAYGRFDAGGRHRACRAHHLRETKHPAGRHGGAVPPGARRVRREPREDRRPAFRTAKMPAAQRGRALAAPTGRDEPRDAGHDGRVPRQGKGRSRHDQVPGKPRRQVSRMFTFLECPGVDPTNNASERALRYAVTFRKIIGQTKGGPPAMRRLADFATCVPTRGRQGKSMYEEVSRLI